MYVDVQYTVLIHYADGFPLYFSPGSFIVVCDQVGLGRPSQEALFMALRHFLLSSLLDLLWRSLLMVCLPWCQCQGASHAQYSVCLTKHSWMFEQHAFPNLQLTTCAKQH